VPYSPHLQPFVDRLTSRSVLTANEQQAILDLPCHAEQVQANLDFVTLGQKVDQACFIVAGLVGRFDQNANGDRQITAFHIPGDMPDLHSVVQPQATSALQALSVATVLRIPHSAIRAATAKHHALAEALWRDCMVDAAILSQWVVNVGQRDAKARIAHLLCEMATRLKVPMETGVFTFSFDVTQSQIADATGLTVVHVNRVLRALRESALADVRRREVHVLDWAALKAVGDFDETYLQTRIPPEQRLRILPRVN
jgi:CRP-like cAMP-binding protein